MHFSSSLSDAQGHSGHTSDMHGLHPPLGVPHGLEAGTLLDALPDNIAVLDASGTIVAVNEAWQQFARDNQGTATVSGVGMNYLKVCRAAADDNIAQRVADGLQAILSGTQMCFALEYPCHSPTRQRWFLVRAMSAPRGQAGAIVVHTEITARKLSEEAARDAELRATQRANELEAVFAAIPDGLVVFDQHGRVVRASALDQQLAGDVGHEPAVQRARHLGLCDAEGRPLAEDQIPAVRALHGEQLSADHPAEVSAVTPDGRRIMLSVTGGPIYGASGQPAGGVLIYRDVTSERQAAQRIRAILERAPDATIVTDSGGVIQLVNQMTEQMFGYASNELVGQSVERLIPARFHVIHRLHRTEYMANPHMRPMGAELRLFGRKRDGSEFPLEVNLAPLEDNDSLLIIVSMRDVSEVERVQAANRELHQLLELTDTALAHLQLDTLLPRLLGRVYAVMRVDNAAVLLLNGRWT